MGFEVVQVVDMSVLATPDYGEMLRQAGLDVEFARTHCTTGDEIIVAAYSADVVIGVASFQPFSKHVIEKLTKCRLIMSIGIGYDCLDVGAATEHGVLAANVPDYCLEEVSDHVMALILALTRKVVKLNQAVREGRWKEGESPEIQQSIWPGMSRLRERTLGLIGFGRIPRRLVPKARSFGMRTVAYDPYVDRSEFASCGVEKMDLDTVLADSDIVSLHSALTSETKYLLGLEQFQKMKASAYLINTARGALVDHRALYQALTNGLLSGAALDVTDPEPIDPADPLLELDNVIITAHSAHFSVPAFAELLRRPAEEITRVLKGAWPVGLINPQVKTRYRQKWG